MSTASGTRSASWPAATWAWSPDMFVPVLVPVELPTHRGEERLLDLAGDRPRLPVWAHQPVVHGADGHDLGRRPRQEGLVGGVEIGAQDVAHLDVEAEVPGDGHDRALGDA